MTLVTPVVLAIFLKRVEASSAQMWIQLRETPDHLQGKWEFPGGKIGPTEGPELALARELREEVGCELSCEELVMFKRYRYSYGDKEILLLTYLVFRDSFMGEERGRWQHFSYREDKSELYKIIPEANRAMVEDLCYYLETENQFSQEI